MLQNGIPTSSVWRGDRGQSIGAPLLENVARIEIIRGPGNVRLSVNYSWQQSIDESTNTDAGFAPHSHAFAKADWRFADNWMLSPQLDWVADRRRVKGDTRPQVPDYTTLDMIVRNTRDRGKWDFAASVRNLSDAKVLEPTLYLAPPGNLLTYPTSALPNDLPMAPRSLWLQVTYK